MYPTVYLKRERKPRIELGHSWVYRGEIGRVAGDIEPGGLVEVVNHAGAFVGIGYYNPLSQITVRLLTRSKETIDSDFFATRLQAARELRERVVGVDSSAYRLIHGESDELPGLTVDVYNETVVLQVLSMGMERLLPALEEGLSKVLNPKGIILRNDVNVRSLEGLEQEVRFLKGPVDTTLEFRENGFKMVADLWEGQKTGYFLDQRENRAYIKPFVAGADVLDCFSHTGSFAIHAAGYGARKVTAVDISAQAVDMVKQNAALNGFQDRISAVEANAFDYLRSEVESGSAYDVVMLDPPAFTKNRASIGAAIRGYKEINLRGLKLVRPGGYMVTSSCSYHMSEEDFISVLTQAAKDSRRRVKIVAIRGQAADHPIIPVAPESRYLKFVVMSVQ